MGCGFFNRPVAFGFCFSLFTIFQVTVGLYIAGVLTNLEKQYRITSAVGGLILSTSDFASLISTVGVSYLGKTWHRPRIIGVLGLMTGLGGILSGLPHFLYPAYREEDVQISGNSTSSNIFVCDVAREEETCSDAEINDSGSRLHEAWALLLGQAIMGLAYGPIFPVAITYIDDQVKGTTTPYYLAVFLTAGTSATLIGFGQAFLFLPLNVNWPAPPDYTKEWIGAWWMGFFVNGIIILFISIPFFFFSKEMDVDIKEEDIPEEKLAMERKNRQQIDKLGFKDFLVASKRICTNFVFMAILVGTVFDLAVAAAFGFFMAKFLEIQFNIPAASSSLFVGIIITPAALIGNICSGFAVKKLKLSSRGCGRLVIALNIITICCLPGVYFISCPEPTYAGFAEGRMSTSNPCNADCTCSGGQYVPVCGTDGMTYSTPCFAGCTGQRQNQTADPMVNITVYTGCTCSAVDNFTESSGDVVSGKCLGPCDMIYFASILLFAIVLFGTLAKNPLVIMTMRCVGNDKTFALGIAALLGRVLGFLPAPLYFGAIIGGACILDRIECGVAGDCLVYDAQRFRLSFLGIFFCLQILSLIAYIVATLAVTRIGNEAIQENKYDLELENNTHNAVEAAYNKGYVGDEETGIQTEETGIQTE